MNYLGAFVRAVIPAPAADIWALVSDPTRHPQLAGSGQVVQTEVITEPPFGLGSRFQSEQNVNGIKYTTVSHVVVYEPERRIAWRIGLPGTPAFGQIWHFVLTPQEDGTLVENGVVLPYVLPTIFPFSAAAQQVGQFEINAIRPTLHNIATLLNVSPPVAYDVSTAPPASLTALLPPAALLGVPIFLGFGLAGLELLRRRMVR